ncbi:hypothetical protein ACFZBU_43660 [Embleya sp. NPDC008237]|uniref:hypothetical protein n=1 Tax=Embleya sp. NPDC008237 TaxID=3363978 RepID=UPI0036ED449B
MRTRLALTSAVAGAVLLTGVPTTAAQALPAPIDTHTTTTAPITTAADSVAVVDTTVSSGGNVRKDMYGKSDPVAYSPPGEILVVLGSDYNSYHHKWYAVRTPEARYGWIYCGNVTAGC